MYSTGRRSLIPTTTTSFLLASSREERKTKRPIRPNPLIPILILFLLFLRVKNIFLFSFKCLHLPTRSPAITIMSSATCGHHQCQKHDKYNKIATLQHLFLIFGCKDTKFFLYLPSLSHLNYIKIWQKVSFYKILKHLQCVAT